MNKLVFINACIRREESRTYSIAKPVIEALAKRYEITTIDLTDSSLLPVTASLFKERGLNGLSNQDIANGRLVAEADRIVIAAPFWDMSFPSVLKAFFEHISAPDLTFANNPDGSTRGICKAKKLLYITTRGMNIETESALDQATSYLKALGWLWGIPEIVPVAVCGTDVNPPEETLEHIKETIFETLKLCEEF